MTTLHSNEELAQGKHPRTGTAGEFFIDDVSFHGEHMRVLLKNGATVEVPLWWYPRLHRATQKQRENWEFCAGGRGLHWPDLDEDLDAYGFIHGLKAPGAKPPAGQ